MKNEFKILSTNHHKSMKPRKLNLTPRLFVKTAFLISTFVICLGENEIISKISPPSPWIRARYGTELNFRVREY